MKGTAIYLHQNKFKGISKKALSVQVQQTVESSLTPCKELILCLIDSWCWYSKWVLQRSVYLECRANIVFFFYVKRQSERFQSTFASTTLISFIFHSVSGCVGNISLCFCQSHCSHTLSPRSPISTCCSFIFCPKLPICHFPETWVKVTPPLFVSLTLRNAVLQIELNTSLWLWVRLAQNGSCKISAVF